MWLSMEWINKINDIINKTNIHKVRIGEFDYNELDVVLSLIQTNTNLSDLPLEMKNYISLLSNVLEKITLLTKEIAILLESFDDRKTILIGEKEYYYNYRLDTYLSEEDVRKLLESHRRCLELFKQFTRKIIYLIVSSQNIRQEEIQKKKEELEKLGIETEKEKEENLIKKLLLREKEGVENV